MNIVLFDAFCALLVVAGLIIAFRKPGRQARTLQSGGRVNNDPQTYIRRIGGVMMMAFGLALAVMVTAFHLA